MHIKNAVRLTFINIFILGTFFIIFYFLAVYLLETLGGEVTSGFESSGTAIFDVFIATTFSVVLSIITTIFVLADVYRKYKLVDNPTITALVPQVLLLLLAFSFLLNDFFANFYNFYGHIAIPLLIIFTSIYFLTKKK